MRRAFFTLVCLALTMLVIDANAQIQTPAPSPAAKVTQTVGLTEVTIEYSRPGMKGRDIFGGLVPYDEVWRLGANAATKITFSEDVILGGKDVSAGEYAVTAKPGMDSWTLMLYPYTTWDWMAYGDSDVEPIMVETDATKVDDVTVHNFMIAIDNVTNSSAMLWFAWDNTFATVALEVNTDEAVMASIDQVMAGPTANDYYAAAAYYASEDKDLDQALEWIDKSIGMGNERFWVLRQKSLIQAKLGDKEGAITTAKKSIELAKEAGNADYVRMNEASIKEWMM